ncbi:MAG: SURF1 family protein [Propionibacteriaceae bacterium]|nr:SURF1 family protein [Propionibacteriaceae bacterium]
MTQGTRLRQWLVAVLGTAVCLTMLGLGLWQMRVFEDKENENAALRAQQPAVPLRDNVAADGTVGDIYGKPVTVSGTYLPDQQVLVVDSDGAVRVLGALQVDDGRVLAVVRGTVPSVSAPVPAAPSGTLTQTGVFLPSEASDDRVVPAGTLASVRLGALAQLWPQQLFPGYITLSEGESQQQGLDPAVVALPTGEGSLQNIGYALQWWVFAAFGAFMTIRFVRTLGRRGSLGTLADEEDE